MAQQTHSQLGSVILGLDPGSQVAGFAVVESHQDKVRLLRSGSVVLPTSARFETRLLNLYNHLNEIYARFQPMAVVVEKIFLGKNADSAFKLGNVRGVCVMQAVQHGATVHEYAAKTIKKVITGSGAATKEHVQLVVGQLVGRQFQGHLDESDAVAIALCHVHESRAREKLRRTLERTL